MVLAKREVRDVVALFIDEKGPRWLNMTGLPINMTLESLKVYLLTKNTNSTPQVSVDNSSIDDYALYSWDFEELPDYFVVSQIPQPGIFFVSKDVSRDDNDGIGRLVAAKVWLQRPEPVFRKYLDSSAARFVPEPPTSNDVFFAYASDDEHAAEELRRQLTDVGLRCFMAKVDIKVGSLWTEDLREAICGSRIGLLLLTPNSVRRSWVMCEAGALWALNKRIVAAWRHIDISELPEIITNRQVCRIETTKEQIDLVTKIKGQLHHRSAKSKG